MNAEEVVAKLRSLINHPSADEPVESRRWWDAYNQALDMAIRIVEDRHTMIDCCNVHCNSPLPPWHCLECDELDIELTAEHIAAHLPEGAASPP